MDASYIILFTSPVVLLLLAWRGCLSRDALDRGPARTVGFMLPDILVAFGLMLVGGAVGQIMVRAEFFGPPPEEGQTVSTLVMGGQVLLSQAVGQLPAVLYFLGRAMWHRRGLRLVGVIPQRPWRDLGWGLTSLVVAVVLVASTVMLTSVVGELFGQKAPTLAHPLLKALVASDAIAGTVMLIASAVLIAPVLEEVIFRGLMQSVLVEWFGQPMRWGVVLLASLVFAMIHADLNTGENWQALPGLFVLGLILGWLYERTGSLWPSIIVHIGFNALNVIVAMNTTLPAEVAPY